MSIRVKNLVKTFDGRVVLDDVSFNVKDGEVLLLWDLAVQGKVLF